MILQSYYCRDRENQPQRVFNLLKRTRLSRCCTLWLPPPHSKLNRRHNRKTVSLPFVECKMKSVLWTVYLRQAGVLTAELRLTPKKNCKIIQRRGDGRDSKGVGGGVGERGERGDPDSMMDVPVNASLSASHFSALGQQYTQGTLFQSVVPENPKQFWHKCSYIRDPYTPQPKTNCIRKM